MRFESLLFVILVILPVSAHSAGDAESESLLRPEAARFVAPGGLESAKLNTVVFQAADVLSAGGAIRSALLLSEQTVVISDSENSEVVLLDLTTGELSTVVRFGQGPSEATRVIGLSRTEAGFAVLDSGNSHLGSMHRGGRILYFDSRGNYLTSELIDAVTLPQQLTALCLEEDEWWAIDTWDMFEPTRESDGVQPIDPTLARLIQINPGNLEVSQLSHRPWDQKVDVSSSTIPRGLKTTVMMNTRLLCADDETIVWNTYFRYFTVLNERGVAQRVVMIDEANPKLPEFASLDSDGRLYRLYEDAAIAPDGHVLFAGISVASDSFHGIDVFRLSGEFVASIGLEFYPMSIDVFGSTIVTVSYNTGELAILNAQGIW